MPTNLVKTPKQEERWERAKELVRGQYPDLSEEDARFFRLAVGIYLRMGGGKAKKQEVGATTAGDVALGPADPLFRRRRIQVCLKRKKK